MSRFLPTLLPSVSSAVEVKNDPTVERASGGSSYIPWGIPLPTSWPLDKMVRDGYEKVVWLWRGIDAIASRAAGLRLRQITGEVSDPDDIDYVDENKPDPLLGLLNGRTSPWELSWNFRYRLVSQLILSKPGVFVEVVRNNRGGIYSLSLLPPQWTNPIPDPDLFISGFRVWVPGAPRYDLPAWDPASSASNSVLWIRKPHPTDPYSGTTPLEAAGLSIDLDFWARIYTRNFMANDGRPGGLLAVHGGLDPASIDELRQRFGSGLSQAGRTSVIEADGVDWVDTATNPRDAQYQQLRALTKEEILEGALGVPETILGKTAGRTYDNADAEREVFWTETMPNYLDLITRHFDSLTEGGEDDDRRLWHDTSAIEVLRRAYEKKVKQALDDWNAGMITIDEYRKLVGRDPIDMPGSKVVYISGGKAPVGDQHDQDEAQKLTVIYTRPVQGILPGQEAAREAGILPLGPPAPKPPEVLPAATLRAQALAAAGGAPPAAPAPSTPTPATPTLTVLPGGRKSFRNADGQTGAMVAFGPDEDSTNLLAPYADDAGSLHCTLAFLGDAGRYDANEREDILEAVDEAVTLSTDLPGTISAITPFAEDDGYALVALLDTPHLSEVRADIVRALTRTSAQVSTNHGFTAHITLSRSTDPTVPVSMQALVGQRVVLDTVILAFGDQVDERPLAMELADGADDHG